MPKKVAAPAGSRKPQAPGITATFADHVVVTEDSNPDWREWPKNAQVSGDLGITIRRVQQLAQEGRLKRHLCPDNNYHFDPAQVQALRDEIDTEKDQKAALASSLAEGALPGVVMKAQIEQSASILKTLLGPFQEMAATLSDANTRQLEQMERMQQRLWEQSAAMEALLSDAHSREVAERVASSSEDRKDALLGMALEHGPALLTQIGTRKGSPNMAAAVSLMKSLKPHQLQVLLRSDALDDQQKAFLRAALTNIPPANGQAKEQSNDGKTRPERADN